MIDDALARQHVQPGCAALNTAPAKTCVMPQAYGVPVATVRMTDFQSTLDKLHDYLLECMELAMRTS